MASRHHTIIFVPHARAKFRKFRVTNRQVISIAVLLPLLGLMAGFILYSYFSGGVTSQDVVLLQSENATLRNVNESFEDSLRELQSQLEEYEDRTRKLSIVAGIDNLAAVGGIGGEENTTELLSDSPIFDISTRINHLSQELSQVENHLEERFTWASSTPSIAPTHGLFTSGFGARRDPITGRRAFHRGMDISAPRGTPVKATADGFVTKAGGAGALGKAVYLSHGYGIVTRYGHLSAIDVEDGDHVKRGQVVGYVGNTGRSTGTHLHYEVLDNGKAQNPRIYILD